MGYSSEFACLLVSSLMCLCVVCRSDKPITFSIEEERAQDTFVGNLKDTPQMTAKYTSDVLSQLKFTFKKSDRQYAYFSIAEDTGEIRTTQRIDRETVCTPSAVVCNMNLSVMITPHMYFSFVKVVINVLDINDHSPEFPEQNLRWSFPETASVGSKFSLPSADDLDAGLFGIQTYELISRSEKFSLDMMNNSDGSIDVKLVLRSAFDRETEESYLLKLVAKDGGTPVKSGALVIDITVTDSNDNNPKFDSHSYEAVISENAREKTKIVQVHATDLDIGRNGQVVYSLAPKTVQQYGEIFGINNQTGEIFVKGTIDYEQTKLYHLSVRASDLGTGTLPAFCKVIVKVTDVNDHSPDIVVNTLTDSAEAKVIENAETGTFVAHIRVNDPDNGINGEFECSIENAMFRLIQMSETEYQIVTAVVFDREAVDLYEVSITCEDRGSPKQTSSSIIAVRIVDANDHTPEVLVKNYFVKIAENNSIGQFVIRVNATDTDIGKNAQLLYKIRDAGGNSGNMLLINASSGIVTARRVFDYEKRQSYEYIITISDRAESPRSVTAMLNLTITDINDESPRFHKSRYRFDISENQAPSTQVGTVTATDRDDPPYNKVVFALDPRSTNGSFSINPVTGNIVTTTVLDREQCATYYLKVTAMNEGYPQIRSSVIVTVRVIDENDNVPIVLFPNSNNDTVQIPNTVSVGQVISRIIAHDPDGDRNGILNYVIANGNEKGLFELDPETGAVSVAKDIASFLGLYEHRTCRLVIQVKDHGEPPLSAIADLSIVVNKSAVLVSSSPSSESVGSSHASSDSSANFMILIGVISGAILLIIAITIAILVVKCRQRKLRKRQQYNSHSAATELNNIPIDDNANNSMEKTPGNSGHNQTMDDGGDLKKQVIKKEVTFNFDVDDAYVDKIPPTWPLQPDMDNTQVIGQNPKVVNKQNENLPPGETACQMPDKRDKPRDRWNPPSSQMRFCQPSQSSHQPYEPLIPQQPHKYGHREESHDVSHGDHDSETGSADSYTDSGRGNSEEGDNCRHVDPFSSECRGDSSIETIDGKMSPFGHKEQEVAPCPQQEQEVALRPQELCRLQRNSSFTNALNNDQSLLRNPEPNSCFTSSWAPRNHYHGLPDTSSAPDCKLRHNQVEPLQNGLYYVPPPKVEQPQDCRFLDAHALCTNNGGLSTFGANYEGGRPQTPSKQRKEVRFAENPTYKAESVDGDRVVAEYIMDAVDADLTRGIELDMLGGGDVMTV